MRYIRAVEDFDVALYPKVYKVNYNGKINWDYWSIGSIETLFQRLKYNLKRTYRYLYNFKHEKRISFNNTLNDEF